MATINEILTLDLKEDIKSVIDLEDLSEIEIQQEIESYIVTEGISRHLDDFTREYTSNIKETGVWISGFYGSGKSYFGKMLGYILANPLINGTPARDRFIPRLKGLPNESFIENSIHSLGAINSRVVFLDIAKQNTENGIAFTLFASLLKNLGFRDDLYGYMEFDFFVEGKYNEFKDRVKKLEKNDWDILKKSSKQVAKIMRRTFIDMGYSDKEYDDTKEVYSFDIDSFSASKFKDILIKYLKFKPDETLVFIFDEASEAISQKKFTLLDMEGISESMSSISQRVWTIAIAQEKLDDVINNSNVSKSQLTKVTDRFKTKIHLESTEVDVIIKNRLLQKNESSFNQLVDYFKNNEGLVLDATNLKSLYPTKTESSEQFATYYPFHKYQFDILQKFLFSSNALVATQIAARGMIITTFDVLRNQMKDKSLYSFTPGYIICSEGQTAPPISLVHKYDTAEKILREDGSEINGEKLLKTIHLLADSEIVLPTIENITKSYISDIKKYYEIKPKIEKALSLLLEAKVLLLANNNYKITSDLEGKLLEEMKDLTVELFKKKGSLIKWIKDYKVFLPVSSFNIGSDTYKFSVTSDQEDELSNPGNKQLKLTAYSLFNISEKRADFVEQVKMETQYNKNLITLIPDNKDFNQIDKLIGEILRYSYMEEKYYGESDPDKKKIIHNFSIIREEKEKDLRIKIENAYKNGSMIYLFDEILLSLESFKVSINEIQQKLIKNIFTKKLSAQLSEGLVSKIFNHKKEDLHRLFSGDDFCFFDSTGYFTGENLKVSEEIGSKIKNNYVDGKSLESELSFAPWGYSFGTIVSTLASMFRAGRLTVKYNGETYFSHDQKAVHDAFTNATKFKSASFKSIGEVLSSSEKSNAVKLLLEIEIETHTGIKVDWNINDFDLADSIRSLADYFTGALKTLKDTVDQFDLLFPTVAAQKNVLIDFTGKVTENNYLDKVKYFIANGDSFKVSIQIILKAQKFIKKNFEKVKKFKSFIEDLITELNKAGVEDENIKEANVEFIKLYEQDMVKNFSELQQQAQIGKDSYYKLINNSTLDMSQRYQKLEGKIDGIIYKIKNNYPFELNTTNLNKLENLKSYCSDRVVNELNLEYSITCKNCGYSLSDMQNYTELLPNKENEVLIIESSIITEELPVKKNDNLKIQRPPRRIKLKIPDKIMTVMDYKNLLTDQLTILATSSLDEKIELNIETE